MDCPLLPSLAPYPQTTTIMAKQSDNFGLNEMTALLGGDVSESIIGAHSKSTQNRTTTEQDVSSLTTAQTASMLKQKDLEKQQQLKQRGTRLRAQKQNHVSQHVALLREEHQRLHDEEVEEDDDEEDSEKDDDNGDDFVRKKQDQQRRKVEPQIVVRRNKVEAQVVDRRSTEQPRRRRGRDSSSSGSDDEPVSRNRKDDGSSSDDSVQDDRRQRLLAKRRQQAEQAKADVAPKQPSSIEGKPVLGQSMKANAPVPFRKKQQREESSDADSSSKGEEGSSDGTSSGSEEESSEDEAPVMAKPLFVPRHKRHTIVSQEQKEEEEQENAAKKKEQEEKRKMQSRLLVAEVVAAASATTEQVDEDEGGGASNPMPNDSDPTNPIELEKERDAWEVRELERLLQAQDLRDSKEVEKAEYERRRVMTDEERLREDKALGLYQRPGEQRKSKDSDQSNFMQRYYHRGAFYMDEEEWGKDDVRHKAKDYERAATGDDKVDKRNLPKVMQVKNFGMARQNTKYKGLAHEDTTDKKDEFLPLAQKTKRRREDRR